MGVNPGEAIRNVRHPIRVILARADLSGDGENSGAIREQVRRIYAAVRPLDRGDGEQKSTGRLRGGA